MAKHKILVIEDSKVIRMLIRQMLPDSLEILEARDGEEGMRLFRKERQFVSLVMLDFWLPKASGWDVFQLLELYPEFRRYIPLVVMADRLEDVTKKNPTVWLSYFAILEKPFEKKELFTAIRLAISCQPQGIKDVKNRSL